MLHEYFFLSRSMFQAARSTRNSSLAARLAGESIELAIKALIVLVGKEPSNTHKIGDCLSEIPELQSLMADLWGKDFDFMIQMVDEDVNTPQMRYGAAGSYIDKKTKLIAAATAEEPTIWTDWTSKLYQELMWSLHEAIWENYPERDTEVVKKLNFRPIYKSELHSKVAYPNRSKSFMGMVLQPEINGIETEFSAFIPIERISSTGKQDYFVRVRISKETAVDQQVIDAPTGLTLKGFRWIGRPIEGVRLKLYEARSRIQPL